MNRFWRFRCSEVQAVEVAGLKGLGGERGLGFRKYLKRDTGAGDRSAVI